MLGVLPSSVGWRAAVLAVTLTLRANESHPMRALLTLYGVVRYPPCAADGPCGSGPRRRLWSAIPPHRQRRSSGAP